MWYNLLNKTYLNIKMAKDRKYLAVKNKKMKRSKYFL